MKSSHNLLKSGAENVSAHSWIPAEELKPAAPQGEGQDAEMIWAEMPQPPQPEEGLSSFATAPSDLTGGSAVPVPHAVKSKASTPISQKDAAVAAAQHHVVREESIQDAVRDWHVGVINVSSHHPQAYISSVVEEEKQALEEALRETNEHLQDVQKKLEVTRFEADNLLGQAHSDAQQVIDEARRRATEIVAQANEEAENITQTAHNQGYEEGKVEGEKLIRMLETVISEVQTWRQDVLSHNEEDMVQILQVITRKLFGRGVSLDPAMLGQTINRVLGEAGRLGDLRIYLHPDDFASLSSLWGEADAKHNGQRIELMASERIVRGGCFVEGEFGSIDNQLDIQVRLVLDALQETFNSQVEEPEA